MKGVLLREVGVVELVELDEPEPAESEVIVEVKAAGICGSDVHSARDGGLLRTPPLVIGHEFAGMHDGRRVAVNPMVVCNACTNCTAGRSNLCENRWIIGIQRPGGLASMVAVPRACLVELPDTVPLEAGAMVEPLAVAVHAVELGQIQSGNSVAILGAGTIGLMIAHLCSELSIDVSVADPNRHRLGVAEAIGVTTAAEVLAGSFDIVFDAVGSVETHRLSMEHLRAGGMAVWVGNEDPAPGFDAQMLVRIEQRIVGSAAYTHDDFAKAASKIDESVLEWATVLPLEAAPETIYSLMKPGSSGPVKYLFRP